MPTVERAMVMETSVNPYESPKATGGQRPVLGIYQPRLMPRDAIDWVLGLSIGLLASGVLYGSGTAVCWLLSFDPLIGIVLVLLAACSQIPVGSLAPARPIRRVQAIALSSQAQIRLRSTSLPP